MEAPYRSEPDEEAPREVPFEDLSPETRRHLTESCAGEGAFAKVREELQTVRFRAPLPGKPENGRTFEQLVQSALVDALLGERKIR